MRYPNWTTKDGKKIPINKMSDSHLCNALRMLKRMAHGIQSETIGIIGAAAASMNGDMASYYAEQDFDRACESEWDEFAPPIFEKMEELAIKRGLKWE